MFVEGEMCGWIRDCVFGLQKNRRNFRKKEIIFFIILPTVGTRIEGIIQRESVIISAVFAEDILHVQAATGAKR